MGEGSAAGRQLGVDSVREHPASRRANGGHNRGTPRRSKRRNLHRAMAPIKESDGHKFRNSEPVRTGSRRVPSVALRETAENFGRNITALEVERFRNSELEGGKTAGTANFSCPITV